MPPPAFLSASYDPWVVAASVVIAMFASYVTLDLAKRVSSGDRGEALVWWTAGSVAMGTGIWSMHFVGMLAYSLPIELGYTQLLTFLSWVTAVGASGVALWIASRGALTALRLALGSLVMACGICAMHYIGMAAIDFAPGIVWNYAFVAASAVVAWVASAAALLIFFWLRRVQRHQLAWQVLAAGIMGFAISGMHYTAMLAVNVPLGAVCLSVTALAPQGLKPLVVLASNGVLALTLLGSMHSKAARLAKSLQSANGELQKYAFLDALTGLPNRTLFEDRLAHALSRCIRETGRDSGGDPRKLAILFIDLDGFKPVNDSFGHAAGDIVLKEAAQRLRGAARDCDTVARVGGDEFLLMLEDVHGIPDTVMTAQRVVDALSLPFRLAADRELRISCSIGIVVYPDHGGADKLVINADAAMYAAKRAGGANYAVYESHMGANATEQAELHHDLRQAIERKELSLHYQPKVEGRRGTVVGVEALLRWRHPQHGMISPTVFIPLAERFGTIHALGNWVIDEACRQVEQWARDGVRMRVAINVSARQLRQPDLVERIEAALARHGLDASQLLCEITESAAMEDVKTTQRTFEGLARIGVFLSIDDFGTGYSSLSYLRQLPARQVKIDHSFVKDIEASADARAVVDAVIRLSHALGLSVVAEGVETKVQRDILVELDCDELQGFYLARPMPAADVLDWVRAASGRSRHPVAA
jgi:diguanylate cyclase (GGDEF)-like protein